MIHITINGTVDAKRLERAFQEALNRFVDYYGVNFDSFYKAEFVLSAKDKNGDDAYIPEPFNSIEFPAPFGEGEPQESDFGGLIFDDDEPSIFDESRREEYNKMLHEQSVERQKRHDEMMLLQAALDNQFAIIIKHQGGYDIIKDFNLAIKMVWEEQKPIANNGKNKGELSFMPFFKINNNLVRPLRLVTSSSNLKGNGYLNPIAKAVYGNFSEHTLEPIHNTVIWRTHVKPRLEKIMNDYFIAASTS